MAEYAQAWRKKLRIKQLVDIAKEELGEDYKDEDIKNIQETEFGNEDKMEVVKKHQKRIF